MMRTLYTLVFLLLTSLAFGQKSTLLQNVNVRAKELTHYLNRSGDSLILEGERTIYKVEIFNQEFEKTIVVKDSKVKIPLMEIPVGRFVVEAVLPDRLIVITLLRNESISAPLFTPRPRRKVSLFGGTTLAATETTPTPSEPIAIAPELVVVNKKVEAIEQKPVKINEKVTIANKNLVSTDTKSSIVDIEATVIELKRPVSNENLSKANTLLENSAHKNVEAYWIVYQTNSNYSAGREMRFGDEALVDKMITHNNLDKRTLAGKNNELTVWEIYDVSEFLKYKMKNRNDFSKAAECFNVIPYFKTSRNSTKP